MVELRLRKRKRERENVNRDKREKKKKGTNTDGFVSRHNESAGEKRGGASAGSRRKS